MLPTSTIIYYVINCVDMVTLGALIVTMLVSKGIPRHPTIPNNLFIWFLQSFSSCMLLLTGYSQSGDVPVALCKIQSALQYGAPPALAAAAFTVVARVWFLTWSVERQRAMVFRDSPWVTILSVAFPYVIWAVVGAVCGIISGNDVRYILEYCASDNQTPSIISGAAAAMLTLIASVFQFWAIAIVFGRYRVSHRLGPLETGSKDTATFIRVTAFFVLIVAGLILSIVATVSAWSQVAPDLALATIGFGIFLIFGTQSDVLETWKLKSQTGSYSRSDPSGGLKSFGSSRGTGAGATTRDILSQHRHKMSRPNVHPNDTPATSTASLDHKNPHVLGDEESQTEHDIDLDAVVVAENEYDDFSRPPTPPKADIELGPIEGSMAARRLDLEGHPQPKSPASVRHSVIMHNGPKSPTRRV